MKFLSLVLIFLVTSFPCGAKLKNPNTPTDIFQVAQDPTWLNLLHYDNNKSVVVDQSFFLSKDGHKNPNNELKSFIKEYISPTRFNEEDIVCRFPARTNFIITRFNLPKRSFKSDCIAYREFKEKVPAEKIHLVFAGENNTSPASMFGHLFLKISGSVNNIPKEHAFSFLATFEENISLKTYLKILINIIDGYYTLTPYRQKISQYTTIEQRPLWEFELNLSDVEKERLLNHMWELKNNKIKYDLMSHNCGNATINLLKVARPDILQKENKFWTTPLEFTKQITHGANITRINLIPSNDYQKKMRHTGLIKDITKASPSSKMTIGFQRNHYNYLTLNFRPVYLDLSDPNNLYYDDLETVLFAFEVKYNLNNHKILLNKFDVLKMTSLIDFTTEPIFSKHFKFSFENNFNETSTHLYPTIEIGAGITFPIIKTLNGYFLPKLGYRYHHVHNLYLNPEIGLIFKPSDRFKTLVSFENSLDSKQNNRGYNQKISASFVYKLTPKYLLEFNLNRYLKTNTSHKNQNEIWIKTGVLF